MENRKRSEILLVEDEESLAVGLEYNLNEEGYAVTWAKDGRVALDLLKQHQYDLVILDIMLPYHDGFEIAQVIRQKSPQYPILILTARKGAEDRIKGLQIGADDYLTKPFHLEELLLRVKGMLKRKAWYLPAEGIETYPLGKYTINFENLECRSDEKTVHLTNQEAEVLKYFILQKGKVVSRKEMLENVWQVDSDIETRTVDIFVSRLRKYFEANPAKPQYFKSVRGAGYIFEDEK